MEEKREWWIDAEIDPERMYSETVDAVRNPAEFKKKYPKGEVNYISAKSELFVLFYDILRRLAESVSWKKKTRIVVEYNPRQERFYIGTVTGQDELGFEETEKRERQSPLHP